MNKLVISCLLCICISVDPVDILQKDLNRDASFPMSALPSPEGFEAGDNGGSSFLQGQQPLTSAEFQSWLHNLYKTSAERREKLVKSLLSQSESVLNNPISIMTFGVIYPCKCGVACRNSPEGWKHSGAGKVVVTRDDAKSYWVIFTPLNPESCDVGKVRTLVKTRTKVATESLVAHLFDCDPDIISFAFANKSDVIGFVSSVLIASELTARHVCSVFSSPSSKGQYIALYNKLKEVVFVTVNKCDNEGVNKDDRTYFKSKSIKMFEFPCVKVYNKDSRELIAVIPYWLGDKYYVSHLANSYIASIGIEDDEIAFLNPEDLGKFIKECVQAKKGITKTD